MITKKWLWAPMVVAGFFLPGSIQAETNASVSITNPPGGVVEIPQGTWGLGKWPGFETDPNVGYVPNLTIRYLVGDGGIPRNGGIQVGFGYPTGITGAENSKYANSSGYLLGPNASMSHFFSQPQITTPTGANYVTVSCSRAGVAFQRALVLKAETYCIQCKVTSTTAPKKGDTIDVVFGSTASGGPGLAHNWEPHTPKVVVWVNNVGNGGGYVLTSAPLPTLLFTGQDANAFLTTAPVTADVGQLFDLTLCAIQRAGSTKFDETSVPVEDYVGTVTLSCTDPAAVFPSQISFAASDMGKCRVPVTLNTRGFQVFQVTAGAISSSSNTVRVLDPANPDDSAWFPTYFGDLQNHGGTGGHASQPPKVRAHQHFWAFGTQFICSLDHTQQKWASFANGAAQLAQNEIDPLEQKFIVLKGGEQSYKAAYECHHHTLFRDLNLPGNPIVYPSNYSGTDTVKGVVKYTLNDFLAHLHDQIVVQGNYEAMCVPHHTAWMLTGGISVFGLGNDPSNGQIRRVIEIASEKGSSENAYYPTDTAPWWEYPIGADLSLGNHHPPGDGASVVEILNSGNKFGFIGSSDQHLPWPQGSGEGGNYSSRPGWAFVLGDRTIPTLRMRIWDALMDRRTYATIGAKMPLNFYVTAGGSRYPMGSEVSTAEPAPVFRIIAASSAHLGASTRPGIQELHILKNGVPVQTNVYSDPKPTEVDLTWQDPAPTGDAYIYFRVIQEDGCMAWASPIWIDNP